LKLAADEPLSNFAFKFNLRRYTMGVAHVNLRRVLDDAETGHTAANPPIHFCDIVGRGLHLSTIRLNVSTVCGIRWVHDFPPVY